MTLNDWKKVGKEYKNDDRNRWIKLFNNKTPKEILIEIREGGTQGIDRRYALFSGTNWYNQNQISMNFKTKQQALKFAKAYMRKH